MTDFGFSRQIESSDQQSKTSSDVGPLKWMAPESLINKEYSNKSDVYSFAITMWEIITGEDPYEVICSPLFILIYEKQKRKN